MNGELILIFGVMIIAVYVSVINIKWMVIICGKEIFMVFVKIVFTNINGSVIIVELKY
tara:strand:+ start:835 stop:1008 length:174 start_codon:yes stop_codon:yes gene_type:complete